MSKQQEPIVKGNPTFNMIRSPRPMLYNGKLEMPQIPEYNADIELDYAQLPNTNFIKNESLTAKISKLHQVMSANKKEFSSYHNAVLRNEKDFLYENLKKRVNKIKNTTELGHGKAFTISSKVTQEYFKDELATNAFHQPHLRHKQNENQPEEASVNNYQPEKSRTDSQRSQGNVKRILTKNLTQLNLPEVTKPSSGMNSSNKELIKQLSSNNIESSLQLSEKFNMSQGLSNITPRKFGSLLTINTSSNYNPHSFKPVRRTPGLFKKYTYVTESNDRSTLFNDSTYRSNTDTSEKNKSGLTVRIQSGTKKTEPKLSKDGEFYTGWKNSLHKKNVFDATNYYFNEVDFKKADHGKFFEKKQVISGFFKNIDK